MAKGIRAVLTLAMGVALLATPALAQRAPRGGGGGGGAPETPEVALQKAPAIMQAAGVVCTPTEARAISKTKTADGKDAIAYETACQEGLGYITIAPTDGTAGQAFDCIASDAANEARKAKGEKEAVTCTLPGNADKMRQAAGLAKRAGLTCQPSNIVYVGTSATTKMARYEIACPNTAGYVVDVLPVPAGGTVRAADCLRASGYSCTLTSAEARNQVIGQMMAGQPNACPVAQYRFLGQSDTGTEYVEIACQDKTGFVLATKEGKFERTIPCAMATRLAGGCTLTTFSAVDYAQKAREAGVLCAAEDSRLIGKDAQGREVIELKCTGRPEGVVAFVPASGKAEQMDCLRAQWRSQISCQWSKPQDAYSKVSAGLAAKGGLGKNCAVKDVASRGVSAANPTTSVVEIACQDGKGYIAELTSSYSIGSIYTCASVAGNAADRCKLSGS